MSLLSEKEAKEILEKALSYSKADECEVSLEDEISGNVRYARNTVTTSGAAETLSLQIQSSLGQRSGSTSINEFDTASLEKAVQRSEELARMAPENPEYMPFLPPQIYQPTAAYFSSTADLRPADRAQAAGKSILPCRQKNLVAAGFLSNRTGFSARMNSHGLFGFHPSTSVDFSLTVRTPDGTGSGYVQRDYNDVAKLNTASASAIAINKAIQSREPKAIEPGKYTVILEPSASVGLLSNMMRSFAARSADEGRSFLSKTGGGTRKGEKMFDERVTITSNPAHPEIPSSPWAGDGRPQFPVTWIDKGEVKHMYYSRYWAKKNDTQAIPPPAGFVMAGGEDSIDDMIRDTRRGVLVTRTWYIRSVDPQTLLYTGLTRDGTFYIKDGRIEHPVKNFRFNESPVIMLNNIERIGRPQRIRGNLVPTLKIRDFTFSSLSDAI